MVQIFDPYSEGYRSKHPLSCPNALQMFGPYSKLLGGVASVHLVLFENVQKEIENGASYLSD